VENPARRLTTRETVLLIVAAAGERVEGRTVMQKLAYFSGLGLGTVLGHRAHFYGPYSARVEDGLVLAAVGGDLKETVERMPDWTGSGSDYVKYTYDLTEQGREKVAALRDEHPEESGRIDTAVRAIRNVIPDLNQKTLSSAAKTYLILAESEGDVSEDRIPELATKLGWKLSQADANQTVEILRQLGLVAVAGEEPEPVSPMSG